MYVAVLLIGLIGLIDSHEEENQTLHSTKELKLFLEPSLINGTHMAVGTYVLDILNMDFERQLLEVYFKLMDWIAKMGQRQEAHAYFYYFNEHLYRFIGEILFPKRYEAFRANLVEGNTILYRLQCVTQQRAYVEWFRRARNVEANPGWPACWRAMGNLSMHVSRDHRNWKRHHSSSAEGHCSRFFFKVYPDVRWTALSDIEVDLDPLRRVSTDNVTITSGKKRTEKWKSTGRFGAFQPGILWDMYQCTLARINLIPRRDLRGCYRRTFDSNTRTLLATFLSAHPFQYDSMKHPLFVTWKNEEDHRDRKRNEDQNDENSPRHWYTGSPDSVTEDAITEAMDRDLGQQFEGHFDNFSEKPPVQEPYSHVKKRQDELSRSVPVTIETALILIIVIVSGIVAPLIIVVIFLACRKCPICKECCLFLTSKVTPSKDIELNDSKEAESNLPEKDRKPTKINNQRITRNMKSLSDMKLSPLIDSVESLPDERDPLIKASFKRKEKQETPKKKK